MEIAFWVYVAVAGLHFFCLAVHRLCDKSTHVSKHLYLLSPVWPLIYPLWHMVLKNGKKIGGFTEVDATPLGLDVSKLKGDSLTKKFVNILDLDGKWPDGDKDDGR